MNTSPTPASASSRTDAARRGAEAARAAGQRARPHADGADDLDARILEAERAVIERDERVQLRAQALLERGQRFAHKAHDNLGRMVGIGVAAGTGALVISRVLPAWREHRWAGLLPHLHARHASDALRLPADGAPQARPRHGGGRRDVPWAGALALAWPFMPKAVSSRINPRLAAFLISLGLPLVARRRAPATRVRSAPHVDLQRYAGRWYEIARMPLAAEARCAGNVSALYRLHADGSLSIVDRCLTRSGRHELAEGSARVVPRTNGSQLQVSFAPPWMRWLPMAWSDYWILRVDDDYRTALVGTPDHEHLWLLSRTPRMAGSDWQRLVEHAAAEGYDIGRLELTRQSRR